MKFKTKIEAEFILEEGEVKSPDHDNLARQLDEVCEALQESFRLMIIEMITQRRLNPHAMTKEEIGE